MATLTVYADTDDGRVRGIGTNWTNVRAGTATMSTITTNTAENNGTALISTFYYCYQLFFHFDTSALTSAANVSDAVFSTVKDSEADGGGSFIEELRASSWTAPLATSDYVAGASLSSDTELANFDTADSRTAGTRYDFTSTIDFKDNINLTGDTACYLSSSHQRLDTTPTGNHYFGHRTADQSGTTNDPKLVVTYTLGGQTHQMIL